jgi:hypothetical protein
MEWIVLFLLVIGIGLNMFVTYANGGKMPVAMKPDDVSFSIGAYTKENFPYFDDSYFANSRTHQPLTEKTRYPFLADHIAYSLEYPIFEHVPNSFRAPLATVGLPLGARVVSSPGDYFLWLMIWVAIPTALGRRIRQIRKTAYTK